MGKALELLKYFMMIFTLLFCLHTDDDKGWDLMKLLNGIVDTPDTIPSS